ncbi:DUF4232 domain-containing protein [Streptomyces griseorubiginosus]|uniref:DUF4232 domain-containing protein n=1 Tax=Streptomyces griseorubiginosus TaxID=67304 RepID=A0A101RPP0_9ACTN|nr:DUF4232 domain-containing protein [Streptomyces griseorubiginosus]KUN59525.1 hypothetical protein AQJ54_39475 [Streptomyces griseorubiginosus]
MTNKSLSVHRAALVAGAALLLGTLTACGSGGDSGASSAQTLSGTAAPATGGATTGSAIASVTASASAPGTTAGKTTLTVGEPSSAASKSRCHTSELRASVGRNDPGAGQENFPIVLTNTSSRTCTVHGYPGVAFLDASGKQLGPDPVRGWGTPKTVTLAPGRSAWAGMTFSNPGVSGAHAATPATLLVTPPDERDPLKVTWTGGPVPVSGNASTVRLMVFAPGTGS